MRNLHMHPPGLLLKQLHHSGILIASAIHAHASFNASIMLSIPPQVCRLGFRRDKAFCQSSESAAAANTFSKHLPHSSQLLIAIQSG
jgi:hypothetical protein